MAMASSRRISSLLLKTLDSFNINNKRGFNTLVSTHTAKWMQWLTTTRHWMMKDSALIDQAFFRKVDSERPSSF
ncbi:NADH dehydrogenase [ubiquinone] iron-sulfur protein 6, mitochondrial-like [Iris pallida]|nr:NADH dehydrogenase [ubiquinone] iron-sulfur protein 6, mitochondrial-like [Iris pallida]